MNQKSIVVMGGQAYSRNNLSPFFLRSQALNAGLSTGYRGCIKKLVINGKDLSLKYPGPDVKEQRRVLPNCGTSPCTSVPCLNGAGCIVTSANTFRCQCQLGYKGSRCEHRGTKIVTNLTILLKQAVSGRRKAACS